jgi:hypothetical protein
LTMTQGSRLQSEMLGKRVAFQRTTIAPVIWWLFETKNTKHETFVGRISNVYLKNGAPCYSVVCDENFCVVEYDGSHSSLHWQWCHSLRVLD